MPDLFSAETKKSIQALSDLVDEFDWAMASVSDLRAAVGDIQLQIAIDEAEKAHQQKVQD